MRDTPQTPGWGSSLIDQPTSIGSVGGGSKTLTVVCAVSVVPSSRVTVATAVLAVMRWP
jgi:hypothetical protein